jgi:hypothetical protein
MFSRAPSKEPPMIGYVRLGENSQRMLAHAVARAKLYRDA